MITQRLLNFTAALLAELLSLLPPLPQGLSDALANVPDWVGTIGGYGSTVGFIIPWTSFAAAAGLWLAGALTAVGIRTIKQLISHFTGGGGAT